MKNSSIAEEINDVSMGRPHVVILGAGASLASFPNGDRNGRQLPVMKNFIEVLGLDSVLRNSDIEFPSDNFEEIYSFLYETKNDELLELIQNEVSSYFSDLTLPDTPTIYDHLLLSLREKDLIATFNWDPFLYNASVRTNKIARPPKIAYLHGNVAIGYCLEDKLMTCKNTLCSKCGNPLTPSNLLFPVTHKNYTEDEFISGQWNMLKSFLKSAYVLTIFGYGAPSTDVEAVELMHEAWGNSYDRSLEEIELIDIRSEDDLVESWSDFIHSHHYQVKTDFYESFIAHHPRRTCESMWNQLMEIRYLDQNTIPKDYSFEELNEWLEPLLKAEEIKP